MSMLQVQPVLMLFRNVENAAEIRQRILQSGMECAVLKPKLVSNFEKSFLFPGIND